VNAAKIRKGNTRIRIGISRSYCLIARLRSTSAEHCVKLRRSSPMPAPSASTHCSTAPPLPEETRFDPHRMPSTFAPSRDPEVKPCPSDFVELRDSLVLPEEMLEDRLRRGAPVDTHTEETRHPYDPDCVSRP
jgi:hypothetical protein